MTLLASNRRVLAARFPEVLAALAPVCPAPAAAHDELLPAFLDEVARSRRLFLFLAGLPTARDAARLLARAPRESILWIVEPRLPLLLACLATEDFAAVLADPRVFVAVGAPGSAELLRLNREFAWVDSARALFPSARAAAQAAEWQPLLVATLTRLQQRWQQVFTDIKLSPTRFENSCANLGRFLEQPTVESLAGAFRGTPLVLVAAGPSLDDALPFLAQARERALVVTGNTSFRALAARGLPPHLTVSVDPYATTQLGYAGQDLAATHFVGPVFAFPEVIRAFAGRIFGLTDQSSLLTRFRPELSAAPAPALMGEATVSATILNLAAYLGCSPVIFVGQDFAIADDGRTHAVDTFYTDLNCNQHDNEAVHALPGTTRPEVKVPARHLWYLRIIEGLIGHHPEIQFINTSHRGATIAGAPFVPYAAMAERLAAAPPRDLAGELFRLHAAAPRRPPEDFRTALAQTRAVAQESLRLSLTAALAGEAALTSPSPAARQRFGDAGARFENWRSTHEGDHLLLFDGCTKREIFAAEKRRLQLAPDDPVRPLREATEVAWAFAEGTAFLYRHLAAAG